jgi:hypothetical protein
MTRLWRLLLACAMTLGLLAVGASAASAKTFYVDERGATTTCLGRPFEEACPTIADAISAAQGSPGANTIEVAPAFEPYRESIDLDLASDKGLTINGEEGIVEVATKSATVSIGAAVAGAVTLSHLHLEDAFGTGPVIHDQGAELVLDEVVATNFEAGANGIEAELGSVTMTGGSVTMERGTTGSAIHAVKAALSLSGVTVASQEESEAAGISSKDAPLSIANSTVRVVESEFGPGGKRHNPITAEEDTAVSVNGLSVVGQSPDSVGIELRKSPTSASGVTVEMQEEAGPALLD